MDKVALITGASSGIGAATARLLAREGCTVILAARRGDKLAAVVSEITQAHGRAYAIPTDMTQPEQVQLLGERAIETFGRVDVLVNNAGMGIANAAYAYTDAEIDEILRTNFVSAVQLTRAIVPHMQARGNGHIINITSVAAFVSAPTSSLYAASKFALRAWSTALRRELYGTGVFVSQVAPGFIRTPMTAEVSLRVPMPGPEVVARGISGLIKKPRPEIFVPWFYRFGVWLDAAAPWLGDWLLRDYGRKRS